MIPSKLSSIPPMHLKTLLFLTSYLSIPLHNRQFKDWWNSYRAFFPSMYYNMNFFFWKENITFLRKIIKWKSGLNFTKLMLFIPILQRFHSIDNANYIHTQENQNKHHTNTQKYCSFINKHHFHRCSTNHKTFNWIIKDKVGSDFWCLD